MPIPVTCPHCHATLKAPESAAGRKVKCPKCSQPMFVPAADEEPLEAVQAAPPAPSRRLAPLPVDDDEDYERPSRDRRSSRQPIRRGDAVLPLILGIVALSLAALGFGLVFIRSSSFCVITGWSLVGAGLVVGLVGLVFAVQYQAGLPLPIAGSSTSAGLLLLMLLLSLTAWRRSPEAELERALGEMARQVQQKMPRDVGMPFNPPQGQQDVEKMAREFEDQMKRVFEEQLKKGFDGKLPPDAFKGAPNLGPISG